MTPLPLFRNLLAATAAGTSPDGAVLTAARLAARHHARLHIVHAVPLPQAVNHGGRSVVPAGLPSHVTSGGSVGAAHGLHALYRKHCPSLELDDVLIVGGVAWEVVFRTAVKLDCDLIVMGPHARSPDTSNAPKATRFLGSTADGVISRSRCPVLIANSDFGADRLHFRSIVVGVDFSGSCAAAVGLAALLAKRCGASVSTFHMLPITPYPKYSPEALQADRERQQARMRVLCTRLLAGTAYQSVLKTGVLPHAEILHFVEQVGADLIVMGSHTKDRTGKWYAGSVVQRITRHARCPVIVVNGPEALTPWGLTDPLA